MKDIIIKERTFNSPISSVWNAITIGEEISKWFIQADFTPIKGEKYTFTAPPEQNCTTISGEILEVNPYTLIYTWVVGDTKTKTTVKWVLEPIETGTKLYLEHSGISNYEGDTAVTMFESFNGGWDNCVNLLSGFLEEVVHE